MGILRDLGETSLHVAEHALVTRSRRTQGPLPDGGSGVKRVRSCLPGQLRENYPIFQYKDQRQFLTRALLMLRMRHLLPML